MPRSEAVMDIGRVVWRIACGAAARRPCGVFLTGVFGREPQYTALVSKREEIGGWTWWEGKSAMALRDS
jgi:hypothetical protein